LQAMILFVEDEAIPRYALCEGSVISWPRGHGSKGWYRSADVA
jgi:hypothetical protein